ncbi:hypothetical protein HJC23_007102 [Cyclotella cryptica]|uniref:Uncharacterized protein n=1 Tax=Cyclotella cryptica TaxID=29204 RepID=A0ABD3P1T3_9STRA
MTPAHAPATQSLAAVLGLTFELDGGGLEGVDEVEFILSVLLYRVPLVSVHRTLCWNEVGTQT